MGLCLQTPSHHPGSIQQRKLHQLQGCGKTHNQVRVLRRNNPCSHCTLSPEGLAHPRAGRWGDHVPFMRAHHQGGADRMVYLVPGGICHSCSLCPSRMDTSTCVLTLSIYHNNSKAFYRNCQLRSENNLQLECELVGLESSKHSDC